MNTRLREIQEAQMLEVIVAREPRKNLTSADLHAAWKATTRGSWCKIDGTVGGFWDWPVQSFEWGLLELPVTQSQPANCGSLCAR